MNKSLRSRLTSFVAAGFFLVGTPSILAYFADYHWTLDLLTHFRLQYAILCLALLLVAALLKNYLAVGCYGIIFGLNLQLIIPYLVPANQTTNQPDVSILLFNVFFGNTEIEETIHTIKSAEADVSILLEPSEELIAHLSKDHPCCTHQHVLQRFDPYSIAIVSKYPFTVNEHFLDDLPILEATVQLPKSQFTVIGAHAPLPWYIDERAAYSKLAAKIAREAETPSLLAGDFNVTPYNPLFTSLINQGESSSYLTDARLGRGIKPTWPSTLIWDFLKIPIDHIFMSSHWRVHSFERPTAAGSDHHPLLARFKLKNQNQ